MNFRAVVLVVAVGAVAGMGWHLMSTSSKLPVAAVGPSIVASSLPEQIAPPMPTIDDRALSPAPQRPAPSAIDCTRGVACPIIYTPPVAR